MATLKARVSGFITGAKTNGTNGLRIVLDALEHWEAHNAPVHFLRLCGGVVASDATAFKRIAQYVIQQNGDNASAVSKKPKDGDTVVLNAERVAELRAKADEGLSFRGFKVAKAKVDYDLQKAAKLFAKAALKHKHGKAAIKAALDAALNDDHEPSH